MDKPKYTDEVGTRQATPELDPAAKRLFLSAHLNLVFKKLRRGLAVEEQEILALLPFTVSNGWQHNKAAGNESADIAVELTSGDADWAQRVAVAMQ